MTVAPVWATDVQDFNCPSKYVLTIVEKGQERQLTNYDLTVVTFNNNDGSLTVSTDDFSLDSSVWIFRVSKISKLSTTGAKSASYDI